MKFGKIGLLGLCLLGVAALILAIATPLIHFNGNGQLNQDVPPNKERHWPISAKGIIESKENVQLASTIEGQVSEIFVDEGDKVKAGQLLVVLNKNKIEARIAAAQATLRHYTAKRKFVETGYRQEDLAAAKHALDRASAVSSEARSEFERQERLFGQGAATQVVRDRANEAWLIALAEEKQTKSRLDKLQEGPRTEELEAAFAEEERSLAELNYLRALLDDYEMKSPIEGVVINRFRDPHETVDVDTTILTIINPEKLRVWVEVEETDAGIIKTGQKVILTVDVHPGQKFPGQVTKVYPAVQRKSLKAFDPVATFDINTQKILVALDDYNGLVHGMSATVRFLK